MNDLEERLRAEFSELTSADLDLGLTADDVLAGGHAARRQRSVRRTVAGVAAALAVGMLSYTAIAGRTLAGVPEPLQTLPAVPSAPEDPLVREFDVRTNRTPTPDGSAPATVRVRMEPGTPASVEFVGTRVSGEQRRVVRSLAPDDIVTEEILPGVVVGVVSTASVEWLESEIDEQQGGQSSDSDFLGEGWTHYAFVDVFDDPTDVDRIRGYVWQGDDNVIHTSDGRRLIAHSITVSGVGGIVYLDPVRHTLNYRSESGSAVSGTYRNSDESMEFFAGAGTTDGSGVIEHHAVGMLPAGSSRPKFDWRVSGGAYAQTRIDGRIVFAVRSQERRSGELRGLDGGLRAITYTDSRGQRVTFRPE